MAGRGFPVRVLSVVNLFVASEALLFGVFMLVLAGGISVYLKCCR